MRLAENRIGGWVRRWARSKPAATPQPEPAALKLRRPRAWLGALVLAVTAAGSAPAAAELQVKLSRPVTGRYESVGISVTDPLSGLDVKPGPLLVTMADSRDHRQTFTLDPTGKPGEWYGRFTPLQTGRYTGTVILDRETQKDIGLVPLVRVNSSSRPGFLRARSGNNRSLVFTSGAAFFPVGVRLETERVAETDWKELLARFRRHQLNYVAVTLPISPLASPEEQRSLTRSVDTLLIEAEQHGQPLVQLCLQPTEPVTEESFGEFQARVEPLVRRWSHSTAIAGWELPDEERAPNPLRARLADTIQKADRYDHLVIGREGMSGPLPGVDLSLANSNWQQPANRRALMEAPALTAEQTILPGEDTWQMLVLGGIGLPLSPYNPDRAADSAVLSRLSRLMEALRSVPYHTTSVPYPGLVPVDTPASFCRYGSVLVGWMAPEKAGPFELPSLPRGRFRVRFWNPATDTAVSEQIVWSDGAGARVEVPANLPAVFLKAEPVSSTPTTQRKSSSARRVAAKPAPKRTPIRKAVVKKAPAKKVVAKRTKPSRKPVAKKVTKRTPTRSSKSRVKATKSTRSKRTTASKKRTTVKSKRTPKKTTAKKPTRARSKPRTTTARKRTRRR